MALTRGNVVSKICKEQRRRKNIGQLNEAKSARYVKLFSLLKNWLIAVETYLILELEFYIVVMFYIVLSIDKLK